MGHCNEYIGLYFTSWT